MSAATVINIILIGISTASCLLCCRLALRNRNRAKAIQVVFDDAIAKIKQVEEDAIRAGLHAFNNGDLVQILSECPSWSMPEDDSNMVFDVVKEELIRRCVEAFRAEHDLTRSEFIEDHWQTLFRIQYPEAS